MSYTIEVKTRSTVSSHIVREEGTRRNRRHDADSSLSSKASPNCRRPCVRVTRPTSCCSRTPLCAKKMSLLTSCSGRVKHIIATATTLRVNRASCVCTGGWSTRGRPAGQPSQRAPTPSGCGSDEVSKPASSKMHRVRSWGVPPNGRHEHGHHHNSPDELRRRATFTKTVRT